mgnify:CR=1 FL=1
MVPDGKDKIGKYLNSQSKEEDDSRLNHRGLKKFLLLGIKLHLILYEISFLNLVLSILHNMIFTLGSATIWLGAARVYQ